MSGSALVLGLLSQLSSEVAIPHALTQPHPAAQVLPAVASGGGQWLVAWPSDKDLFVGRVDASGVKLDPLGVRLGPASGAYPPALAWNGARFLVAWDNTTGLFAQEVDAQAVPVGSPVTVKSVAAGTSLRRPALACNGSECLLAHWTYNVNVGHQIYLTRLSPSGAVLQADIPVTAAVADQHEPAVAWDGTQWLVAWRDIRRADGGDIYATRVSTAGVVQEPTGIAVSVETGTQRAPAISWNGSTFMVVWQDARSQAGLDQLYAARISSAGAVLDAQGLSLSSSTTSGNGLREPAIGWNGTEHLVAYAESYLSPGAPSLLYATRVSPTGTVLQDHLAVGVLLDRAYPAVSPLGAEWLVAWQDRRNGDADVYAARVTPGGNLPATGFYLHGMPSTEFAPALAASSAAYLLAWTDYRDGSRALHVRATRLDPQGTSLDGTGFVVSPAAAPGSAGGTSPTVAFGGTAYLVAYLSGSKLQGVRVGTDGTLLDPAPLDITSGSVSAQKLASNGADFLVVWQGGTSTLPQVFAATVSSAGAVGPALDLSRSSAPAKLPTVAFSGEAYLVAWEDWREGRAISYGARLTRDGALRDCAPLRLGDPAAPDREPRLAGGPAGFLLFSSRTGGHSYRRLDPFGVRLDATALPFPLTTAVDTFPAVTWNGASYWVSWVHRISSPTQVREFRAARISISGAVLDSAPVTLGTSPEEALDSSTNPLVVTLAASTQDGRAALFYTRRALWGFSYPRHEVHLHGRFFDASANGAACTQPDTCASGVCKDASCCDRACASSCGAGRCADPPWPTEDGGWRPDGGHACPTEACAVQNPRDGGCLVRCPPGGCPTYDGGSETEPEPSPPSPPPLRKGRCSCSTLPASGALVLLALGLLVRRKRRAER